jgi:hypothetical protein
MTTTYADPTRCPDCRAVLPHDPQVCRVCSLPLTGATAVALFRTFQEADRLLGVLREQKRPVSVGAVTAAAAAAPGSLLEGVAPYPAPDRPTPAERNPRVKGSSVPRILLSLGALCLLVAAVIFLAYAWRWLGVGGRTGVLVGLTGVSLGLSVALLRRRLVMAAESLSVIGLGLLAIDVVGARHAGWLGPVDDAQLTLVTGSVVATGALLLLVASASRPMYAPALIAPLAVMVATFGAQSPVESPLPSVVGIVVLLGLGRIGTVLPSRTLAYASLVGAVPLCLYVGVTGLDMAGDPITFAHYVGDLSAWPVVALTVLIAVAGPATGVRSVELGGYALASLVGTFGALLPVLDNGSTPMTSAVTAVSFAWAAGTLLAPSRLRPAALVPLAATLVVPVVAAGGLVAAAGRAVASVGEPLTRPFTVHVAPTTTDVSRLLLVPELVAVAVAACAALHTAEPVRRPTWVVALGTALGLGSVATLPLYDVPLAAVVGVLTGVGIAGFVAAERAEGATADAARLVGLVLVAAAALLALPSDRMVTAVLAVACVVSAFLMARTDVTGSVASLSFPLAFASLVWTGGHVVEVDGEYRAIPVLLVLGALAIWRPQLELEASSVLAGAVVSVVSVSIAHDLYVSMAVHLTIAGVLVTASSIVHPSRRLLAWPGGLLLAAATWVRLYDIGVDVPEAYTLPSALALVAVGAWRLHRDDRSATLTVLAPGLSLATVPSLVATLDDPASPRALLLGVACLALVVGGAALRWGAPLVVGSVVGGLLVLRELAPYAASVPTWVSIGASGAVLLAVGITWESRMNDVRRASRYVAALR